jgi:FkbH-like protein
MSCDLFKSLSWLPRPPSDFAIRCRSILETEEDLGGRFQALASFALDENQLDHLARVLEKARQRGCSLAPLVHFRLGVLSNSTTDFIVPALIATGLRHGIALECVVSDYGQIVQEALSPDSAVNRQKPDAVLIAVDYRGYPLNCQIGNLGACRGTVEGALVQLQTIRAGIRTNSNAICIVQNLAPPAEVLFGSLDRVVPGNLRGIIDEVNRAIAESIRGTQDVLLDVAGLAATVGLAEWHSPEQWNMAKLPFSSGYLPLYADHVTRTVAALRGKSRRCLIMDLDNTLWGGVIGDDGLEGIQLAQGDAVGEAYLSVQRYALSLRERGVVLAVSSKNDDEVARSPFREHPEMLLREEHIAVLQANWNDKATNIKAIADELSLGLDSMVFLDDNPVERGIVRQFLPQVAVPELPSDPALFVRTLSAAGYFEAVAFSNEDMTRADFYQDNARRVALQRQYGDVDGYLASLQMVVTFQPFDETGRARISQLINKSNQYNLTTRRYTEAEVAAAEHDPNCFTLQVRLADCFGDNGMISVVICKLARQGLWELDTWLMSCRVLGRRVESMVLQEVLSHARNGGVHKLIGKFIPSGRNQLVEGHYAKLGFTQTACEPDGVTVWELEVEQALVEPVLVEIHRVGWGAPESTPA